MDLRSAMIERIFAADPRGALEAALSELMTETGADAAGLFVARSDPALLWGVGVDQLCLDRVQSTWRAEGTRLRDGRLHWSGSWCIWPGESGRGVLLLYLGGAAMTLSKVRSAVADVSELLGTLTDLQASDAAPHGSQRAVDLYLRQTSAEAVERRQLLLALHEAEWNLARVARMLGVTRVTVYKRMRRHGIERLKVRKTRVAPAKTEG